MSTGLHKDLPDSELHEAKGAAGATNGQVLTADGAGAATFETPSEGHSHANKAQLDLVTDGDHDVRTDNPHGVTAAQAGAASASHNIASHSDTTATGAQLNELVGGGETALHSHAGGASVFGQDYQSALTAARTETTSTSFVTKTTLTTPELTGTYRVAWHAVIDHGSVNSSMEARLYNATDDGVVGAIEIFEPKDLSDQHHVYGVAEVVFTGAAKTFNLQYRAQSSTAGIQDASIELWRVS
jgi:hypothetical protein